MEDVKGRPVENVEGNVGAGMADVAEVVGHEAAEIHPDLPLDDRPE